MRVKILLQLLRHGCWLLSHYGAVLDERLSIDESCSCLFCLHLLNARSSCVVELLLACADFKLAKLPVHCEVAG